ncbi:MAG: tellurite resistance TerB family protein [Planctomycetota bacterium]|jgi:uncharacterized tellurite resistance protein B-like protein
MSDISYDKLQKNIASEEAEGTIVRCTFICAATGKTFPSEGIMKPVSGIGTNVKKAAKRGLFSAAKRGLRGALRSVFGSGIVGQAAQSATSGSINPGSKAEYNDDSRKDAVVAAFLKVSKKFAWSKDDNAYVVVEHLEDMLSEFDKQLRDFPLKNRWDKAVCARALAEIAGSDGKIEDEEQEMFNSVLDDDTGSLDEVIKAGKLSNMELDEVTPDARGTILMLGWMMAFCDEKLDDAERDRLTSMAEQMGFRTDRLQHFMHIAAEQVVVNMLEGCYEDGSLDEEEKTRIAELAGNIGVNEALVAKLDVKTRIRLGIS